MGEDQPISRWPLHMRRWFWRRVGSSTFRNEVVKDPDPTLLTALIERGRPETGGER